MANRDAPFHHSIAVSVEEAQALVEGGSKLVLSPKKIIYTALSLHTIYLYNNLISMGMLSPDSALILWQITVLTQLLGSIYALVQLYRHPISFKTKTVWCFVIFFIPLGWIVYLAFRKQVYSGR